MEDEEDRRRYFNIWYNNIIDGTIYTKITKKEFAYVAFIEGIKYSIDNIKKKIHED